MTPEWIAKLYFDEFSIDIIHRYAGRDDNAGFMLTIKVQIIYLYAFVM